MRVQKVLVTGGNGKLGRVVVQDLRDHGYTVTSVDKSQAQDWRSMIVDCEDLGQVTGVMSGNDAVIHLAAIPHPLTHPPEVVYRNNVISTFNILEAAAILGIKIVVLASSVSALGSAFMVQPFIPRQIPITEEHPLLSQDAYGLSKMAGEELASGYCRRIPDLGVTSLRFSFIIDADTRAHYLQAARERAQMAEELASVFWTYVDVRDAAASCRLALETQQPGHAACYICAPTIMVDGEVETLMARYFPGDYPVAAHIRGSTSPIDCALAERILGWKVEYNLDGNPL